MAPATRLRSRSWSAAVLVAAVAAMSGACGDDSSGASTHPSGPSSSGSGGATGAGGAGGGLGFGGDSSGPFNDFPAEPILDPGDGTAPPADSSDLFGPAGSGEGTGGPCLVEPPVGALFPRNWVRPRFTWAGAAGENLFELRITAPNQVDALVVYTTASTWTMPKDMWTGLASHSADLPLTVTIRGATLTGTMLSAGPALGTSGDVSIAPAEAAGAIVYWRTVAAENSGELKGFTAGDESVVSALTSAQVQVQPGGNSVTCIGCHTSTPDGKFAAFKTLGGTNGGALASVEQASTGQPPLQWSTASIGAMSSAEFGIPSFSKAHWKDGDYLLLSSWGNGAGAEIAWFDLQSATSAQGTAYDFLARDGDARGAIMPSFSHDGETVVYTSTNGSADGRPTSEDTDVFAIPFANRAGGAASPVEGAADPAYNEYYPSLSPDDALIAFNRVASGTSTYNEPQAELFALPSGGGAPTRLAANDPVACSGKTSPGVTNSWPKWSPEAVVVGDRTFYWLAFSSTREGSLPQLYITGVVVKGGAIATYPAVYIWPQPSDEANHTPAWDVFKIPIPPPN